MQVIAIHPSQKRIEELSIEIKPDTIYTYFQSILIDEITSLRGHTIYVDSNALEQNQTPYFLADQLLIGETLITGTSAQGDKDIHITRDVLKDLISYDVPQFYKDTFKILSLTDINLYHLFSIHKNGQKIDVNIEWVVATFNIADEKTKKYFLDELQKSLEVKTTQKVLIKMAQLAINVD